MLVGDKIDLRCTVSSTCPGNKYNFYHFNLSTGEYDDVHHGSYKFNTTINNLADAGEYYCIKECARNISSADKCHWNIAGE